MKKICCVCSQDISSQTEELLLMIREYTKNKITLISPSESIADFEVVVFVLSKESRHDESVALQLKEASDLNKTFIPVILGGNWFTTWLLKRKYKGPDLRSPFLSLNKDKHMYSFMQQLASSGGSKILGDVYGCEVVFNVDLDCKVFRDDEVIAETGNSHSLKITLYKGQHKLKFQSTDYPELVTDIKIKVKNLSNPISMDVKIARHRIVSKRAFGDGFYEGSLYLDVRDGEGTFWYPNGDVYKGSWVNDTMSGVGTYTFNNGTTYVGDWLDGDKHGHGKITWGSKNYYEGDFYHDEMTGRGKRYYDDGSYYEGDWDDGEYHGKGTKRYSDGSKYVGDWVRGLRHGHGIEYNSYGKKVYEGEWKNGEKLTLFNRIKNWWNSL